MFRSDSSKSILIHVNVNPRFIESYLRAERTVCPLFEGSSRPVAARDRTNILWLSPITSLSFATGWCHLSIRNSDITLLTVHAVSCCNDVLHWNEWTLHIDYLSRVLLRTPTGHTNFSLPLCMIRDSFSSSSTNSKLSYCFTYCLRSGICEILPLSPQFLHFSDRFFLLVIFPVHPYYCRVLASLSLSGVSICLASVILDRCATMLACLFTIFCFLSDQAGRRHPPLLQFPLLCDPAGTFSFST